MGSRIKIEGGPEIHKAMEEMGKKLRLTVDGIVCDAFLGKPLDLVELERKTRPKDQFPFPACDVCKRQVDRMESYYSHALHSTVFTVFCHGESEQFAVTDELFADAISIEPGVAFRQKRIE